MDACLEKAKAMSPFMNSVRCSSCLPSLPSIASLSFSHFALKESNARSFIRISSMAVSTKEFTSSLLQSFLSLNLTTVVEEVHS